MIIKQLDADTMRPHLDVLCGLLKGAIDAGVSMSFLPPLSLAVARNYWEGVVPDVAAGRTLLFVAMNDDAVVGTVQLALAWQPNSPHRAEVQKLIVDSAHRRRGIGGQLMRAVEREAQEQERSLLVLDTAQASDAEHFYRQLGYTEAGTIPGFALDGAGVPQATVIFYKQL